MECRFKIYGWAFLQTTIKYCAIFWFNVGRDYLWMYMFLPHVLHISFETNFLSSIIIMFVWESLSYYDIISNIINIVYIFIILKFQCLNLNLSSGLFVILKTLLTGRHQRLKLLEIFLGQQMAIEVKPNCQYSISNDKKSYFRDSFRSEVQFNNRNLYLVVLV